MKLRTISHQVHLFVDWMQIMEQMWQIKFSVGTSQDLTFLQLQICYFQHALIWMWM